MDAMTFRSPALGEFTMPLGKIESLVFSGKSSASVKIDAAVYGSDLSKWMATGVQLNRGDTLSVKASGMVELWPQAPGQYQASPKGYNTSGKGGKFQAGVLVGRIGVNGKEFVIGESVSHKADQDGELFMQIIPSPWNSASEGCYNVSIRVK